MQDMTEGTATTWQERSHTHQVLAAAASCGRHGGLERLLASRVIAVVKEGHSGGVGLQQLAGCSDSKEKGDERDLQLHGGRNKI